MKKLLILLTIILLTLISCDFPPVQPKHVTLSVRGIDWNVYWQLLKDGDTDTGEYSHYPVSDYNIYDIEPGTGYTVRLYKVDKTIIDGNMEKRLIGDTYETHFTIDHWETEISVIWTKESGLGLNIEKNWPID